MHLTSVRDVGSDDRTAARPAGMRRRDLGWRLCGMLAIAAAGVTTMIHRQVLAGSIQGPPSGWEIVLGLTSFVLASLGVLLLIHGAALRDGWVRPTSRADPIANEPVDPASLGDDRSTVASLLAARAIRAAASHARGGGLQPGRVAPDLWTSPSGRA